MIEALQFEFMRNALMAGLFTSIICGVIGTLIVVNRIVFLSGGIAHAAYGGIGIAFFFGLPFLVGTVGFTLLAAMVMAAVTLKTKHRADTIVGVLWAVGMAVGVEARAWGYAVLVDHAQGAKAHVERIVIVAEGKGVAAVEPAEVGMSAGFAVSDRGRHGGSP